MLTSMSPRGYHSGMDALMRAIQHVGSQSGLARYIGSTPQTVSNWIKRGNVPAEHCPAIERATGGKVRCEEIRPDVEWGILRAAKRAAKPADRKAVAA